MISGKTIVFVFDDFSGGAGNIAQLVALEYSKENRIVLIPINRHSDPRYDLGDIEVSPYRIEVSKRSITSFSRTVLDPLRKEILSHDPNVVVSFLDNTNTLVCLALRSDNLPLVVSERCDPKKHAPRFPWGLLRRVAYRRADAISIQFEAFRGSLGSHLSSRMAVTPNVVRLPDIRSDTSLHSPAMLVSVGRLVRVKRFDRAIEAAGRLVARGYDIRLDIYGEGPLRKSLQDQIDESGLENRVFLRGRTDKVHDVLACSDVFLMTSDTEGFPNALSEALSVGLPSVSYGCHAGVRELVGQGGFVVPPQDNISFADAITEVLDHPETRRECSRHARLSAERYSWSEVSQSWDDCLGAAIRNRAS